MPRYKDPAKTRRETFILQKFRQRVQPFLKKEDVLTRREKNILAKINAVLKEVKRGKRS